jgi:hypothetical protein
VDQLDAARHLAEAGVPLFLARHSPNNLGFALPSGWEKSKADPTVVDRWRPGMALCAVMGHAVDAIDIDPRNGGSLEALRQALGGEMPKLYGVQRTPSGGQHLLIAPLGVRKAQSVVPGVDVQAGKPDGMGRGFIFLAPTVRDSKITGQSSGYSWEQEPDLDFVDLDPGTGEGLRSLVEAHHGRVRGKVNSEGSYDGPVYSELTEAQQHEADEVVAANIKRWRAVLEQASTWPEGHRDGQGRGWEALAYQCAWALAKMAACPWMAMGEDGAALAYDDLLPPELAADDNCADKWFDGIVEKAEAEPVDIPPWVERGDAEDDFGVVRSAICDASSVAGAVAWLDEEAGRGRLSGLFRRKDDLVYTALVGEEGYELPGNMYDDDGPSQIRRLSPVQLARTVSTKYKVQKRLKNGNVTEVLFPEDATRHAMSILDNMRHLNRLKMVTHTPIVRADGTVLDQPGYDKQSGALYLPGDLVVPPVPEEPTEVELKEAVDLLMSMIQDFPFVNDHNRANYLSSLLTPLIRSLAPPPYRLLILSAPQRGSGKSLLAMVMRILHGGVFRTEIPREEAERVKVIATILDSTSAPIVQFDNVSGNLSSPTMDGLLTSAEYSERRLGGNTNVTATNDRLWVVTGNNVTIGGDMDRRVLWSTIDANDEHPELRPPTQFAIPDLEGWVREHRGELLNAMLTIIRAWVVAGQPVGEAPTSDTFGRAAQVLQGILTHAGIEGTIAHETSAPVVIDPETEEWTTFLSGARGAFGDTWWTVRTLLNMVEFGELPGDCLPGDLADKLRNNNVGAAKSLGKLLGKRRNRWAGGFKAESRAISRGQTMEWRVVARTSAPCRP